MAIRYKCVCGAMIKLPDNAVDKKARCKKCDTIFTVPHYSIPEDEPIPWLDEFAHDESTTGDQAPVVVPDEVLAPTPEPIPDEPLSVPGRKRYQEELESAEEQYGSIISPAKPFWQDLIESFTFLLYQANFITFIFIVFIQAVTALLSLFVPLFGIFSFIIYAYICSFFMTIILETAYGEDELPTVAFTDIIDQVLMPMIRFIGSWLLVLIPAIIWSAVVKKSEYTIPWWTVQVLGGIGIFFWPVVILCTAIGGSFKGLWPHVIIRTVLSAPLPYLAIWASLLAAAGLMIFPHTDYFTTMIQKISPLGGLPIRMLCLISLLNIILSTYAMIVAMRAIGLYYRHYKKRFPWTAE